MDRNSGRIGRGGRFVLLFLVLLAASGGGQIGSAALPAPENLVPNTVVRISDVPDRAGTITRAEFRHALAVTAAAQVDRAIPRPGDGRYGRLMRAAVDGLIETVWIQGQAAEMGIVVTRQQVLRELALIKEENFGSAAEYRRFLRYSRLTRRDVVERVELQIITTRIQRRIVAGAKTAAAEQKAYDEFLAEFNERWRARTVCAPAYVTSHCSNGPPQ